MFDEIMALPDTELEGVDAMFVRRSCYFFGREMRHNTLRNAYIERVVRPMRVRFEGKVHERITYDGRAHFLKSFLEHRPFSKGIENWIRRRNSYSTLQAQRELNEKLVFSWKGFFAGDPVVRRRNLAALYRRTRLRPVVFILYNMFVKFAFLDGWRGFHLITLEAFYEYMVSVKIRERKLS